MSLRRQFVNQSFALLIVLVMATTTRAAVGFQPVSPDELKMTSEPLAPGAPAIILYRQVDRDDFGRWAGGSLGDQHAGRREDNYYRIKILTEAGRKYGDVEIRLSDFTGTVTSVRARTIHPNGSIVEFDGKVLEKTLFKGKGEKYRAKTFALPDVQVGSIIEYYYTIQFQEGYIFFSRWILSDDLFTKSAKFSLKPFYREGSQTSLRWNLHLPPGAPEPKQGSDEIVRLEVNNVPAFQREDLMPPENEFKSRVNFIYTFEAYDPDVNKFWSKIAKIRYDRLENFVGKRGAMEKAVAQIAYASDSPEVKLQKIYARVQQLRNTSYEAQKTEEEKKREKEKSALSVEEVWKQGYGDGTELTWLYLALVRAAGFEAYGVWVSPRSDYFFSPQTMDSQPLSQNVVLVKLNGKDLYFDPGAAFTPFGLLPWAETGVQGLRLDKGGLSWVQTALPDNTISRIERKANLKLSAAGDLEGRLTVTYSGLESLRRRVDQRNEDDAARKKFLEDELKESIPAGSEVDLSDKPEWTNSTPPLVAEFSLKVPGWASVAGSRLIVPVGLFGGSEKHLFEHSGRVYPVYFEFPEGKLDDVTIELPPGWQVSALPQPQNQDVHVFAYSFSAENNKGTVHLTRKLDVNIVLLDVKYYEPLRSFFQGVKSGDEERILLQRAATASK